ncbi:molybdopterin dinucleotide binding domain-containing protein, partial [Kitasatospora sp. NPDC058263]
DRGSCLAGAVLSDDVMPGVVQLSTGAWWDPVRAGLSGTLDRHGNPNSLTADRGCSRLSQGPSAHSALVDIEVYDGPLPEVLAFMPPHLERSHEELPTPSGRVPGSPSSSARPLAGPPGYPTHPFAIG